jgi:hypothetical protein
MVRPRGGADPRPDLVIKGCTAVIQSGQGSDSQRAFLFFSRGSAYFEKDDYDRPTGRIHDRTRTLR